MCRIAGFWEKANKRYDETILSSIRDTMSIGGPDDAGNFIDEQSGVYLAHRRLSIIDISAAGHQPMQWNNYVLIFNGEIYNYLSIKTELESHGYSFESGSDTEVLLKSFHHWGLDCVQKFRGMFAFAIWNKSEKKLYLCRDRAGVKPLFYYNEGSLFLFSSEMRGIMAHPDFKSNISKSSVAYYLRYGYTSAPATIFGSVKKQKPGSWLIVDGKEIKEIVYWNPELQPMYNNRASNVASKQEFIATMEEHLIESCKLRTVADVPVGVFLSGGIDSSVVTSLLQHYGGSTVKTFTIGFTDPAYNEAGYARQIARHLQTDHHEYIFDEQDFIKGVREITEHYDEPFGDSSCIPTYLLSKFARDHVKVALSADGGDEVFGGYTKYIYAREKFKRLKNIPLPLRQMAAGFLNSNLAYSAGILVNKLSGRNMHNLGSRLYKFSEALTSKDELSFLENSSAFSQYPDLKAIGINKNIPYASLEKGLHEFSHSRYYSAFLMADMKAYLEGDILTKIDRATMHNSLEGREPLLDHLLIEAMIAAPDEWKISNGTGKLVLRSILEKYVPSAFFERPKQGFTIPLNRWLKSFFKKELICLANDKHFAEMFYLDPAGVKQTISMYLAGKSERNYHLVWFLYVLYMWHLHWHLPHRNK